MAGIYVHIPFCKQACHYCDFHFSTSTLRIDEMVTQLCHEISTRANYLNGQSITSIYFGGGTPSLLSHHQLMQILESIFKVFQVDARAEITLEANPDDLHKRKLDELAATEINRLSIGVQSFDDKQLVRMNRAHQAKDAEFAIKYAQDQGIENITADLMFALPDLTTENYANDLRRLLDMGVQHLSAYGLTIEPKTVFHKWSVTGKILEANSIVFEQHFRTTPIICAEYGLQHYEVSNFGKKDFFSRHNTAYWKGEHYLGIGPSAHSYDGRSRQWNVANNPQYMNALISGKIHWEREEIDHKVAMNEYLLTRLRTSWGIDINYLRNKTEWTFGDRQLNEIDQWISQGWANLEGDHLVLNTDGWLQVDTLTAALFD
jgi:oxygen-independent coproporphyrinogen III oxidase